MEIHDVDKNWRCRIKYGLYIFHSRTYIGYGYVYIYKDKEYI